MKTKNCNKKIEFRMIDGLFTHFDTHSKKKYTQKKLIEERKYRQKAIFNDVDLILLLQLAQPNYFMTEVRYLHVSHTNKTYVVSCTHVLHVCIHRKCFLKVIEDWSINLLNCAFATKQKQ